MRQASAPSIADPKNHRPLSGEKAVWIAKSRLSTPHSIALQDSVPEQTPRSKRSVRPRKAPKRVFGWVRVNQETFEPLIKARRSRPLVNFRGKIPRDQSQMRDSPRTQIHILT